MKNRTTKKVATNAIATFIIIFVLLAWAFGVYAPLVKSRSYIANAKALRSATSISGFLATLDNMRHPYAPLGEAEVNKFMGNDLIRLVRDSKQNERIVRAIVYYYEPIVHKDDPRQLITLAQMYETLWERSGREADFRRAEQYYLQMNHIGPKLPQPLYSLLEMYTAVGATENAIKVAENISTLWPEDEGTKETLRQLRASQ